MRSLRTYNLEYQNDVDTGQFQLHRVTMIGQETKPERNLTLPGPPIVMARSRAPAAR